MVWSEENPLQTNMAFSTQSLSLKIFKKNLKTQKNLYTQLENQKIY